MYQSTISMNSLNHLYLYRQITNFDRIHWADKWEQISILFLGTIMTYLSWFKLRYYLLRRCRDKDEALLMFLFLYVLAPKLLIYRFESRIGELMLQMVDPAVCLLNRLRWIFEGWPVEFTWLFYFIVSRRTFKSQSQLYSFFFLLPMTYKYIGGILF